MDRHLKLIQDFYGTLPQDRVKVETSQHGFPFLAALLADGAALEYGELTLAGILHKYKLSGVPAAQLERLLRAHLAKECNVCLYFGAEANSLFCFNLDNNHKENNTALIPEMVIAVRQLRGRLAELGCEPLVVASGRGYHLWVRLEGPVANGRLRAFMLAAAVKVVAGLHEEGRDYHQVKFNFYPDPRTQNTVSLRLFGSDHAKNKVFSRVLAEDGTLLDEAASWDWFEEYLRTRAVAVQTFERAELASRGAAPLPD